MQAAFSMYDNLWQVRLQLHKSNFGVQNKYNEDSKIKHQVGIVLSIVEGKATTYKRAKGYQQRESRMIHGRSTGQPSLSMADHLRHGERPRGVR
jgi:hypothetical protein